MPQSFAAVYVHIVFSTKHRPAIRSEWSERLYQYVGGIVANGRGELLAAGGTADHVHLLVSLGREWSLANLLRDVKAGSSKWVHDNFPSDLEFRLAERVWRVFSFKVEFTGGQAIHRGSGKTPFDDVVSGRASRVAPETRNRMG